MKLKTLLALQDLLKNGWELDQNSCTGFVELNNPDLFDDELGGGCHYNLYNNEITGIVADALIEHVEQEAKGFEKLEKWLN